MRPCKVRWGYRFVLVIVLSCCLAMPSGCTMFIAKKAYKVVKAGVTELMSDDSGQTTLASRDGSSDKGK